MNFGKIKTVLIVLLLIVNIFLLSNILFNKYIIYDRDRGVLEDVQSILASKNILYHDLDMRQVELPPIYEFKRIAGREYEISYNILGEAEQSINAAGEQQFSNNNGIISWDNGGFFKISIDNVGVDLKNDDLKTFFTELFRGYGFNMDDTVCEIDENDGNYVIDFQKNLNDIQVFNWSIRVILYVGGNVSVEGRWIADDLMIASADFSEKYSKADCLLYFISNIDVSEIYSMDLGYYITDYAGGRSRIIPVWRINTNVGYFYVDIYKRGLILS